MHARSHVSSSLFKIFLPHSNRLKYLGLLITGLSVIECFSCSVSSIAYFSLFVLILLWTFFDSLSSVVISLAKTLSGFLLSIEQTCGKFLSAMISFYLLLTKSQTFEIGISWVPVISVLTGSTWKIEVIVYHHTLINISC